MRLSLSERQKNALLEASKDRRNFGAACEPSLTIAGREMTHLAEECVYEGGDKIACTLEATVLGRLPDSHEQEPCYLTWLVNGEELPGFEGRVVSLKRKGAFTEIIAATGGYEAQRTPLGEDENQDREWRGIRPDTALYDALSVLPYKDYALGPFPEPLLYKKDEERFSWTQMVSAAIAEVEKAETLKVADLPTNVASAYPLSALSRSEAPVWSFEEGVDTDEVEDETADDERYARVLAYRTVDGIHERQAEARIDNGGRRVFPRSALALPYTGEVGDSAYGLAYAEAVRRGTDDRKVSLDVAYPPFMLSRGDVFSALAKEYTGDGVLLSTFHARLVSVKVDALNRKGSVSGQGFLLNTETAPLILPRFPTPGGFVRPLWGFDTDGTPYFDDALPYVVLRDGEHFIDVELAGRYGVFVIRQGDGSYLITDEHSNALAGSVA